MTQLTPTDILSFWFNQEENWFNASSDFDNKIRNKFEAIYQEAISDNLTPWEDSPDEILALIIILDQFSRNMFRGTRMMYHVDDKAVQLTKKALDLNWDKKLEDKHYRQFLYMPLMHSESLPDQELSVKLFEALALEQPLKFAKHHRNIIKQFNRFPHRNEILDRAPTEKEIAFMQIISSENKN